MSATTQSPAPEAPLRRRTPEELERHWFEHVYAGDHVPQLTLRAVLMGTVIGCVMAFSNLYVGLKTGWGLNVAITACIISYTVFRLFHAAFPARGTKRAGKRLWIFDRPDPGEVSILENNCMQSTASSAGYSTASTLVSAFPAYLMITGHHLPYWTVAGLVLGTGLLGVFLAVPMKRTMINVEQLPFPSGTAAAETLRSLHQAGAEARKKARSLFTAMGLGAVIGWLRDGIPSIIPTYLPISQLFEKFGLSRLALLSSPSGYTITVEASTVYAAAGAIMGIRTAASMALGALLNYAVLAPWLHDIGVIKDLGYRGIVSWSVWGGASLMTSAALVNFFLGWRTIARAFSGLGAIFGRRRKAVEDPMAQIEVPGSWFAVGVILTSILVLVLNDRAFGIPILLGSIAILSTALLSVVASRATGETDTTPLGALGKITQLLYGVLMPQNIAANLMTANITGSSAATSADLLTDLKSGYLLGANPRKQFLAQFLGVWTGTLVATWGYYQLVPTPAAIGGDKFPAPAAQIWRAVAEVLARGFHSLPRYAATAMLLGAILGVVLSVAERLARPGARKWIPSPVGFGMAFTFQGYTAMAFFLGGLFAWIYEKKSPKAAEVYTIPVASGFIAGETLMGVAITFLQVRGLQAVDLPPDFDVAGWAARWDRMQECFLAFREERFLELSRLLRATIAAPRCIVDLGWGTGSVSAHLLEAFPHAEVVGVDQDPTLLALARGRCARHGARARFVRADLRTPHWSAGLASPWDAAVSATALHWLAPDELQALYRRLALVLAKGAPFLERRPRRVRHPSGAGFLGSEPGPGPRPWLATSRGMGGVWGTASWRPSAPEQGTAHEAALGRFEGVEEGMPLHWHLDALRLAGFSGVDCFWRRDCDDIYGGVRSAG